MAEAVARALSAAYKAGRADERREAEKVVKAAVYCITNHCGDCGPCDCDQAGKARAYLSREKATTEEK